MDTQLNLELFRTIPVRGRKTAVGLVLHSPLEYHPRKGAKT